MERFIHQKQKPCNVLLAELRENIFQILVVVVVNNLLPNKLKLFKSIKVSLISMFLF